MLDLAIAIQNPRWQMVCSIPPETVLLKGRRNDSYRHLRLAARAIELQFGCYSWGSATTIFYCGSFARDYARKEFQTNLEGRIHNYLQSHGRADGRKNTNRMVFDNINELLAQEAILLRVLLFDALTIGTTPVSFSTFSEDADLVHTVEQLLICTYRRRGECAWNRT